MRAGVAEGRRKRVVAEPDVAVVRNALEGGRPRPPRYGRPPRKTPAMPAPETRGRAHVDECRMAVGKRDADSWHSLGGRGRPACGYECRRGRCPTHCALVANLVERTATMNRNLPECAAGPEAAGFDSTKFATRFATKFPLKAGRLRQGLRIFLQSCLPEGTRDPDSSNSNHSTWMTSGTSEVAPKTTTPSCSARKTGRSIAPSFG